jgi:hypothetical protein
MMACAIVLLAFVAMFVGYNILIVGTGVVGAFALLHSYWRDTFSDPGATHSIQRLAIVAGAVMLGWRAAFFRDPEKR